MIAIIDYGAGNLFSVKNALDYIGEESVATDSIEELRRADGLILPGVGAFPDAQKKRSCGRNPDGSGGREAFAWYLSWDAGSF